MKISYAKLHTPLFFNGINFGIQLDTKKKDIELAYNGSKKTLFMRFQGKTKGIPDSNIADYDPADPQAFDSEFVTAVKAKEIDSAPTPQQKHQGKIKAQVSDPVRDVVFGPGK